MISKYTAALAGALLAGSVTAGPVAIRTTDIVKRTPSPMTYHCAKQWDHETLFAGSCPALSLDANVNVELDLSLPKAAINGDISIGLTEDFLLNPTIAIDVSGLEAYVELDLSASAAIHESIELMASASLALEVPGLLDLGVDAGVAIDLLVGVSAAIDVEAGFHLTFPPNSVIEVSLLNHEIVGGNLANVVANILPIGLGLDVDLDAEIELFLGLRARVVAAVGAGLDILGLDIGAGAEVAVWINLFSYTQVLVSTPQCALSVVESLCLDVGVAIELDVEVADIIDISLAPTVSVTLAALAVVGDCKPTIPPCARCGHGGKPELPGATPTPTGGSGVPTTTSIPIGVPTGGVPTGGIPTGVPTGSAPVGVPTGGVPTGVPTGGAPTGGVPTTIYETTTYTVTQCAVTVPNCPAGHTQVVITSVTNTIVTTVPTGGNGALPVPTTTPAPENVEVPVPTETRSVTITSCPAETNTFTPPANAPSVPPTYVVPDTPAVPTGGAEVPSVPEVPAVPVAPGHSSSAYPEAPVSVSSGLPEVVPTPPTDCIGCVGPTTGVSTPSHPTPVSPPAGGDYTPPEVSHGSTPVAPAPSSPIPTGGASRMASGAAGFLAIVAGFALL